MYRNLGFRLKEACCNSYGEGAKVVEHLVYASSSDDIVYRVIRVMQKVLDRVKACGSLWVVS